MADLGFGSRAEMMSFIRQNLAPDTATIGKSAVREHNLYLPTAYVSRNAVNFTVQNVTNTIVTPFTLLYENKYNNGESMWDATQPDRLIVRKAGWYIFAVSWNWGVNINGQRHVYNTVNGAGWDQDIRWPDAPGNSSGVFHSYWKFNKGDYVQGGCWQNSGVAIFLANMDIYMTFVSN